MSAEIENNEVNEVKEEKKSRGFNSYLDILELGPFEFIEFLSKYKAELHINIEDEYQMTQAGNLLGEISNIYSFLSTLREYASTKKRQLKKSGSVEAYEEMIDKEAALESTLKSVDMQYRAINKAISLFLEVKKENYMTGSVKGQPY